MSNKKGDKAWEGRRGLMFILASPSGAGKSTISRLLLEQFRDVKMSVSVTTRPRRSNEVDGVHYIFRTERQFMQMRERGELLEWAKVHGNFYGTPREPVEEALRAGTDVLFDIDVQGTLQLYEEMRDDIVSVFLLPPAASEMRRRIEQRAADTPDMVLRRLNTAKGEIGQFENYDYVIVNDDLDAAYESIKAILTAERLSRVRQLHLGDFVDDLSDELESMNIEIAD